MNVYLERKSQSLHPDSSRSSDIFLKIVDENGILWEDVIQAMMAVLCNQSDKNSSGVDFFKRDGTTKKVEITHDSLGNRTVSTIN